MLADAGVRAVSRPEVQVVGGPPMVARGDGVPLEVQPVVAAEVEEQPWAVHQSAAHQSAEQVVAARRGAPVDHPVEVPGVSEEHQPVQGAAVRPEESVRPAVPEHREAKEVLAPPTRVSRA